MIEDLSALTHKELVGELTSWAGRVAAGEAVLLRLIAEFDARDGWAFEGSKSCAHWLSWRLGLTMNPAHERVRVARALRDLPLTEAALAEGRMSYAQVRAVTRVATAADEDRWIDLAAFTTAAQLERAVRGVRRCRGPLDSEQPKKEKFQASYDDDGWLQITVLVRPERAPAVLSRIEQAQAAEQSERAAQIAALEAQLGSEFSAENVEAPTPEEPCTFEEPYYPVQPEGVFYGQPNPQYAAAIAEYWAEHGRRKERARRAAAWAEHVRQQAFAQEVPSERASMVDGLVRALTRPESLKPSTVVLQVDPLSGWSRTRQGELLPAPTLAALLKSLPSRLSSRNGLASHDLGRRSRLVSPALRALLGQVDGERCRFPSCDATRHLHAHHVRFWRHGGRTDLANLALVCSRHHTLIHTEGFQLVLSDDRTLTVRTAGDIPVPHHPDLPVGDAKELTGGSHRTKSCNDRFDLDWVVMVMAQQTS